MKKVGLVLLLLLGVTLSMYGLGASTVAASANMVLATTTSTYDSGLLHHLLPEFEAEHGIKVEVISVGTGQAMEIGKRGDADIILVHARNLEDAFVADGYGTDRWDVMYNDFVYLGPVGQEIEAAKLADALLEMVEAMEQQGTVFISRGDNSGTHNMERSLWPLVGLEDASDQQWYLSIGQGMGDALITANEMQAYVLTDRGTYLAMKGNLQNLQIVFEGAVELSNPYGIIPVNPEKHSHVKYDKAMLLVEFFVSEGIQAKIGEFGREAFGQPLFFPNAQ